MCFGVVRFEDVGFGLVFFVSFLGLAFFLLVLRVVWITEV